MPARGEGGRNRLVTWPPALVSGAFWWKNGVMGEIPDPPGQQFAVAWQIAVAALDQWRKQVTAATAEARENLEPAARAALEAARAALGGWRPCQCPCDTAHPQDVGVCDGGAVLTRRLGAGDVHLCAPCAVAQGVAEMRR